MTTVLRKLGYEFECGPNHKYATIRPFRSQKCTRTFRLGPAYEKEAMRERLLENQRNYRVTQSYYAFLKPYSKSYARENPPTEAYYRKREFYCKAPRITGYVSFFGPLLSCWASRRCTKRNIINRCRRSAGRPAAVWTGTPLK